MHILKEAVQYSRIAITHYQFETIHPYADGNGRIGRLLIMLQMINYGLIDKPTLYLSDFFEKHRQNYYGALTEVKVNQNLGHWLAFILDGVIESAKSGKQKFEKIMTIQTTYYNRVMSLGRRANKANTLITTYKIQIKLSLLILDNFICITGIL